MKRILAAMVLLTGSCFGQGLQISLLSLMEFTLRTSRVRWLRSECKCSQNRIGRSQ